MKQMHNSEHLKNLARKTLTPLAPIPTETGSRLTPALSNISVVLFDIYGTLLVSGTGDIGVASSQLAPFGLEDLLESSGFTPSFRETGDRIPELLERFIKLEHKQSIDAGIDFPEVEIRDIWKNVLEKLWNDGLLLDSPDGKNVEELAIRYEMLVNPVWMMPGFPDIVVSLSNSGYRLGIVSNAQFYTPLIISALVEKDLEDLGFSPQLCAWSYEIRQAKPSPAVFRGPLEKLRNNGIAAEEVLYVGNDLLNDVACASQSGCRTALFAGDRRSLRLRESDSRANVQPDIIITELAQLHEILG